MEVSRGARGRDVGCGVAGVTEEKLMMDGVKGFVDYGVDCVFGCLACVGAVWVGGDAHLVLSDHCTQRPHVHLVVWAMWRRCLKGSVDDIATNHNPKMTRSH